MHSSAEHSARRKAIARRLLSGGLVERTSLVLDLAYRDPELAETISHACLSWYGQLPDDVDPARIDDPVPAGQTRTVLPRLSPWRLDFPGDSVDVIYVADSDDAAAFLTDPHRLEQALAVLAPGGRLFCIVKGAGSAAAAAVLKAGFAEAAVGPGPEGASELIALKSGSSPAVRRVETPAPPPHRRDGYQLLCGDGLEIGAFNEPAPLPPGCRVRYFDAIDATKAAALFPEIDPKQFVRVDFVGDLDRDGMGAFADGAFDFAICNHVIEHVANPIRLLRDLFRIVRRGGHVVLSAPDKRYTFDHERPPTEFAHLWDEFERNVSEVTDEHYMEFIRHVAPHVLGESAANQAVMLRRLRERREHAHAWDSQGFRNLVDAALARLNLEARLQFESIGDDNRIEFFGIWMKP